MIRRVLFFLLGIATGFILLVSCTKTDEPTSPGPIEEPGEQVKFYFGVDLSYVNQVEDNGGVFRTITGEVTDPFIHLARNGANLARIRIWHNPSWVFELNRNITHPYSGYVDVVHSIRRAKHSGMNVLLNFHYSDTWADPGKQDVPQAWRGITNIDVLADSVYNYTFAILRKLHEKNLLPQMVQIGNETNCGMMWTNRPANFPNLDVCRGNWANFGRVVNAGIRAVRDIDALAGTNTRIILHVADPRNLDHWTRDVIARAQVTDFDVMGFSYYHIWHNAVSFNDLPALVANMIQKYNRDFMVLETAYPFTTLNNDGYSNIFFNQAPLEGFPYTVQGQRDFLIALNRKMINAGALGVIYWEPAWITSRMRDLWGTGSSWENVAFFDFYGRATSVLEFLSYPYPGL